MPDPKVLPLTSRGKLPKRKGTTDLGECGCGFGSMSGILGSIPDKNKRKQKVLVP